VRPGRSEAGCIVQSGVGYREVRCPYMRDLFKKEGRENNCFKNKQGGQKNPRFKRGELSLTVARNLKIN
jgi:hypothetical protein